MATRIATLSVLLLLLAAPAAQATLLERWANQPEPEPPEPGGDGNEALHRLWDVDGDGADEVLRVRQTERGVELAAAGGPGLDQAVWRLDLPGHWFAGTVPDQDGDGHDDLLVGEGTDRGSGNGYGVPFVSAWVFQFGEEVELQTRSSADGGVIGHFDGSFSYDQKSAFVYPLVTYAYASSGGFRSNETLFLDDQRFHFSGRYDGVDVWTGVAGVGQYGMELDVSVLDIAGGSLGTATFGDERVLVGGGLGDVDGDGTVDVAVVESTRPVPADLWPVPAVGADVLTVVSGRDAGVLWQVEGDPGLQDPYRFVQVTGVGDLDGDGRGELALHEYADDGFRFTLRSGADGAILEERTMPDQEGFALPWGDVDADGRAEYLWVTFGDERIGLSARGLGGDDLWTARFDGYADPIMDHYLDLVLGRWTDWTLDGVPDLLMGEEEQAVLLDGATGERVFEHDAFAVHGTRPVADLTGDGGTDLLFTGLTDEDGDPASEEDSNVTLRLQVLRGRDGATVWTSREPGVEGGLRARGTGIGDVNGDGLEDLLVELTASCCEFECHDGYCDARPAEAGAEEEGQAAQGHRLIHSGRDGRVLWRDGSAAQAAPERAAAEPTIEPGAAFPQAVDEGAEAPVPAWTLMLALAAVLWVRRRR